MKKRHLIRTAGITVLLSVLISGQALAAAPLIPEDRVEAKGTEAAPPGTLDLYIQVGDSDRTEIASYSSTLLRAWARRSNPSGELLKYSSTSYSGYGGRVAKEYIPLADFFAYAETTSEVPLTFASGDYLIMGEDFTKDSSYYDAGYTREDLMGNWYAYDAVIGTDRYYFPYWNAGNSSGAVKVPAVIGIRSYGNSSGVSDAMLDYYAASCDYLWAYVIYYGQTVPSELTYPYFYYGQDELTIEYPDDAQMNGTIQGLLEQELAVAKDYLDHTAAAASGDTVAQGSYWVTQTQYRALEKAYEEAAGTAEDTAVRNRTAYEMLLSLEEADETFAGQRKPGQKSGYFWYTDHEAGTPYHIMSADQIWELSMLVNGTAYDTSSQEYFDEHSFAGETVVLDLDIDADGIRPCIGTASQPFLGTFDGQQHTISGLSITGLKNVVYTGFFGYVGTGGQVRNLTLEGEIESDASCVGGIAGYNGGVIEGCASYLRIEDSNTANGFCGGIAGRNDGTVINCLGACRITGGATSGSIAGQNRMTLTGCYGGGTVSDASIRTGLAGANTDTGTVKNCIAVSTALCGSNKGTFFCCYTLAGETGTGGGVSGHVFCDDGSIDLTSEEVFAQLDIGHDEAAQTGSAFVRVPGAYPALEWQMDEKAGDVNLDGFTDSRDAVIVLRYAAGKTALDIAGQKRADYNRDTVVDQKDAQGIRIFSIGRNRTQ